MILVGNKNDLQEERAVQKEEGEQFAQNNGIEYFLETSALSNDNVGLVF